MRLKGISWFEQNFEKVFAGVFGAAAIGVLVMQFGGKPATVKVGPKETPMDQAYEEVARAAKRTREGLLRQDIEPPVAEVGKDPIAMFERAYRGPIAPARELAMAPGRPAGIPGVVLKPGESLNAPLAAIAIPAPAKLIPYSSMLTVHPSEAKNAEVAAILPKEEPFDKASVTVEARFNGKALRTAFEADPDGAAGPARAMRKDWWENMQLLAVEMERQQLKPDGDWGEAAKVHAMPGRFSLLADIEKGVNDQEGLSQLRTEAADRAAEIRRPDYYDRLMGEEWLPPADNLARDEAMRAAGVDPKVRKQTERAQVQKLLETKRQLRTQMGPLENQPGQPKKPQTPDRPPPPSGGGGGGKSSGGGGAGPRNSPPPPTGQPTQKKYTDGQRLGLDRDIAELEKNLDQINKDLGIVKPDAATPSLGSLPGRGAKGEPSVLDSDDLRIWAHDVTVERGKVYRYRLTLVFNNPLFGKGSIMVPEQAAWARETLARSAPSEWTKPVQVDPETYWFIVSANEAGGPGGVGRAADARAELYMFTMGYWRRGSASIEVGDRVQADISVPDRTKLAAMKPAADPNQPPAGEVPAGGGGKRGGGGAAGPAGGRGAQAPAGERAAEASPVQIPMVNISRSADAVLLGVGSQPLAPETGGRQSAATEAFVLTGGAVQVRLPEAQKVQAEYAKVSRSANAARSDAASNEPEREKPENPGRDRVPPRPPAGGNGPAGGGSGGG